MVGYLRNKALIDAGAIGPIRGGVVQWNTAVGRGSSPAIPANPMPTTWRATG